MLQFDELSRSKLSLMCQLVKSFGSVVPQRRAKFNGEFTMSKKYDCIKTCRIKGETVEKGESGFELDDYTASELKRMKRVVDHVPKSEKKGKKD